LDAQARRPFGSHRSRGSKRAGIFLEFFAADIRNPHTRRAYARAAEDL
jgi:hypothetical protein